VLSKLGSRMDYSAVDCKFDDSKIYIKFGVFKQKYT
jgi:hypothetical protein